MDGGLRSRGRGAGVADASLGFVGCGFADEHRDL